MICADRQRWIDVAPFRSDFFDGHEPVRLGEWQRAQHYIVDEGKDRGRRANAESERHDRNHAEAWRPLQLPESIAKVLTEALGAGPTPGFVRLFANERYVAEGALRGVASFFW